jgi:serine/threonine protein kinase/tetratricopeptide (TPR) repeat protein
MKRTQHDPTQRHDQPPLPQTEPDPSSEQTTAPSSDHVGAPETVEFSHAPQGETQASQPGAQADRLPPTARGEILSFAPPSRGDTHSRVPGGPIPDGPSNTDHPENLAFLFDSQGDESENTLPLGAQVPETKQPRVAGYEILEVLGIGGMGIVYKARQVRLDRFVALKMIRAGAGARPQDLARFEEEAKAVAAIEHPNIVRIFEIGEYGGMPYCSLEYLAGGSLTKKIGGKPQPVDEAARIVETLAGAMEVAHQHKIIHRDLKPANVLLAADGTLKITDFGLVKRLEGDSSRTRSGTILGTPSYMAPEQARGETQNVGPAADQYALGAILYELLTGRPPFQGTSVLDTLDQVRKKEPVPPSQLQPKMPRDIETICLKCLEKEPSRRYPDVAALTEDLRRYRAGKPIVARPISDPERLWRWCLRNPLGAAVASLLVIVAAVSTAAAMTVSRTNQALATANAGLEKAKTLAESRRIEAENKQKVAEAAVLVSNAQNLQLVDANVDMIELLEGRLRHAPDLQDVRQQYLDKSAKSLDMAAQMMADSTKRDVRWDWKEEERNLRSLARASQRLGELYLSENRITDAMDQYRRMDELVEQLATATPNDLTAQIRRGRSKRQLGNVTVGRLGDIEGGRKYLVQAIEIHRACLAKEPDNDTYKSDLANSLGQLALAEMKAGHLQKAREVYREEEGVRESFSSNQANHFESRRELSGLLEKLGALSLRLDDINEARRLFDLCAAIREEVLAERRAFWPAVYDRARSYNNAAFLEYPHGRNPAAAREFHRRALKLVEERAEADPKNLDTQAMLAEILYYDATCALHSNDPSAAAESYRRCLEIRKRLVTEPAAKMSQVDLMVALARCGEPAEAVKIADELVAKPPTDEHIYFQAACGYALAAAVVGPDEKLVAQYTARAVECLRKDKEKGWTDVVTLETDPDLEPIRSDPAFKALIAQFPRPAQTPQ